MASENISEVVTSIKKGIEDDKIIIGLKEVIVAARAGEISRVFVASNCSDEVILKLRELCALQNIEFLQISQSNDDLGVICKKPYAIMTLALKNE